MMAARTASYLEGRVLTASQPQLHLMLIEGALRFGQQARKHWDDAAPSDERNRWLERVLDIAEELAMSAAAGTTSISKQLEEQYAFIFRELGSCRLNRDLAKLESCLKLLEYQRETWKMACERLQPIPATKAPTSVPTPHAPFSSVGGFSVEA